MRELIFEVTQEADGGYWAPSHQRISIPDHNPIRLGTLNSILRLVARHKGAEREDILRSL